MCRQTTDLVASTTSSHDKFIASLENFSQEVRQLNSENQIMLEESSEHSEHLRESFIRLCHETDEWGELANTKIIRFTDQQMSAFSSQKQQLQCLQMVNMTAVQFNEKFWMEGILKYSIRGNKTEVGTKYLLWTLSHVKWFL